MEDKSEVYNQKKSKKQQQKKKKNKQQQQKKQDLNIFSGGLFLYLGI